MNHHTLVSLAKNWLAKECGCSVVLCDPFYALVGTGERPDAIGWRSSVSILVECKTSFADFLADSHKPFRERPETGMGDWRFFLCPDGVIQVEDLPAGWGLLWAGRDRRVRSIFGVPGNTQWRSHRPFAGQKEYENAYLVSALSASRAPL